MESDLRVLKFCVVGGPKVGKTCLIRSVCHNFFDAKSKPSQQLDFSLLTIPPFQVHIWVSFAFSFVCFVLYAHKDIPSSESTTGKTPIYYNNMDAAFVVADATNPASLKLATKWFIDVNKRHPNVPVVLLINKADLKDPNAQSKAAITEFSRSTGFKAWFEISALENKGFHHAMQVVVGWEKEKKQLSENAEKTGDE